MSGLPSRLPGESDGDLLDRLLSALTLGASGEFGDGGASGGGTTIIYDDQGRPIITPQGVYAYSDPTQTQFTAPVQPNIVQINTDQLVAGAVTLAQTDIPTMVLATQAVIGDAVILTLLAGEIEAVSASIDNLSVNNANIVSLAAGKLTAGTISAGGILVGSSKFELDGANQRIRITDGTNTRVDIGKIGAGSTDYGIKIFDAAGTLIMSSGATSSINGAYIAAASIGSASINDLAANKITAGTLAAGVIYANAIAASQIVAGTMTGFLIQTTNGVSQATTRLNGSNNRLESFDASGNLIAAVGQNSLGGAVYANANSSLFAGGSFSNSAGGAALVGSTTGSFTGLATIVAVNSSNGPAVSASSGSDNGVHGTSSSAAGVRGTSSSDRGVLGESTSSNGADFKNVSGGGGWGSIGVPTGFGGWAFYSQAGGYGPFTGQHDGLLTKTAPTPELGDIMVDTDTCWAASIDDAITVMERSSGANQKGAIGVFRGLRNALDFAWIPNGLAVLRNTERDYCEDFDTIVGYYDLIQVNSVGEGCINVCGEAGDIAVGDLIVTSSMPGKGMKQADDIIRQSTVAKARGNVAFSSPTEIKQIACVYLCG